MSEKKEANMDFPMVNAIRQAYREGQEDEALEPIVAVDPAGRQDSR